jgi:hypothetical protein
VLTGVLACLPSKFSKRFARVEPDEAALAANQGEREENGPVLTHRNMLSLQVGDGDRTQEVFERPKYLPLVGATDRAVGGDASLFEEAKYRVVVKGGHPIDYVAFPVRLPRLFRVFVRGREKGAGPTQTG